MKDLTVRILALAMQAAELGRHVEIAFRCDDDAVRAVADLPGSEVHGIVSVVDGIEPRIALTADVRCGPEFRVRISASQHRTATSAEMEAASGWNEQPAREHQPSRRVGTLRRLP